MDITPVMQSVVKLELEIEEDVSLFESQLHNSEEYEEIKPPLAVFVQSSAYRDDEGQGMVSEEDLHVADTRVDIVAPESLESIQREVTHGRRIICSVKEEHVPEPAAEDALEKDSVYTTVVSAREENKIKKNQKKNADGLLYDSLLQNKQETTVVSDRNSGIQTNISNEVERLKAQLEDRNAKLKELEKATHNRASVIALQNIATRLEQLTKAIENQNRITEHRFAELEKRVDEYFGSYPTPQEYSASSSKSIPFESSTQACEMVPLGFGISCPKAARKILFSEESEHHEWATTLLQGVFGENAHLMRVKSSKKSPECIKFGNNFLLSAKLLYEDWLKTKKVWDPVTAQTRPYTNLEIKELCQALPGYLADRSYSLHCQMKKSADGRPPASTSSDDAANPDTQTQRHVPTGKKRLYRKKGEVHCKRARSNEVLLPKNISTELRQVEEPQAQEPQCS